MAKIRFNVFHATFWQKYNKSDWDIKWESESNYNVTAQQITLSTTTVHEVNKHILKMFNLLFRYETRNIIRVLNMIYTSVSKYPRLLEN